MSIEKRGFKMQMGLEMYAVFDPDAPQRKGHFETEPLTDEDRAVHARAKAALKELESNPWAHLDGYDGGYWIEDLEPRRTFVPDESHEEYVERLKQWWKERA